MESGEPLQVFVRNDKGTLWGPLTLATVELLIDNLRKSYAANAIVVGLETPDEGVTLRGSVIPDLPGSVIDTLRPGASTRRADTFKRASRCVVPMRGSLQGKQEISIHV